MKTIEQRQDEVRKAYLEKREAQLREWSARIELWRARASRAEAEGKIRYQEGLSDLARKIEEVGQKLARLRQAGDEAWEDVRTGVDAAVRDLKDAIRKAGERF